MTFSSKRQLPSCLTIENGSERRGEVASQAWRCQPAWPTADRPANTDPLDAMYSWSLHLHRVAFASTTEVLHNRQVRMLAHCMTSLPEPVARSWCRCHRGRSIMRQFLQLMLSTYVFNIANFAQKSLIAVLRACIYRTNLSLFLVFTARRYAKRGKLDVRPGHLHSCVETSML